MTMMIIWAAVFISYGISTECAMRPADCGPIHFYPLDMAPNSVDDMYDGCKGKMKKQVQMYLKEEKNNDRTFKNAWGRAEIWYKTKWMTQRDKLGKKKAMAIYVYTVERPNVYRDFNAAVRTQRSEYSTTFSYHALHFFLTDALQTLNADVPEHERCVTVYRRVSVSFREVVVNKEFRFGSFTSSSKEDYPSPTKFGDKSCFEIKTCFGADITRYSNLGEAEREVLIPPYEIFTVTDIKKRAEQNDLPCEVVYIVNSTRETLSNTNCALLLK